MYLKSSSESTVDRQVGNVKWASNVKFKDSEEKRTKEPSEIMYTENPLHSLHAVYTVPINVIGGIGSAIGGTFSGWGSSQYPTPSTEYTPSKNTNPTTDELIEERRKKKALDNISESIQLTDSYDISPLMTPSGYHKTPVIESSSDSFTATAILRTLFIDPTKFAWSSAGKESDFQAKTDDNEEIDFAFENVYGEAEPTKLDFINENNDNLDFQYENSDKTLESLKKREEEEQIVYQTSDTNIADITNTNTEVEKSEDQSPSYPKVIGSVENYHPKRKAAKKPFSDAVLKRKINLRFNKSEDLLKTHIPPVEEKLNTVERELSTPSINLKPNPNQSPDDFDFQYVHMYPSPVISMKMSLAQEISTASKTATASTTNHHNNILEAIKPKTFPIMQHRNIVKKSSLNSTNDANKNSINLDDWENRSTSIHDDNSHSSNINANGNADINVGNTTAINIKEYLEAKEMSEIDEDLSRENSEVYEFQHKLSNMESATKPTPPGSAMKTPPNTPTISSAPSAIKIISSITAWMIPLDDGDDNDDTEISNIVEESNKDNNVIHT